MVAFDRTQATETTATPLRICIAGIGKAGSNVLERIILEKTLEASLVSIQTDVRALNNSCAPDKIQLGADLLRGIGTGGDPELGREGAMFSKDKIRDSIDGHDIVFIVTGLGGGTGSGAAPIVAEIAKSTGALVFVFAEVPFGFEGRRRQQQSRDALERLERSVDSLVLFENDRLGELVLAKEGIQKAFALADQTISCSIRAVANMVSSSGLVKLSIADLIKALSAKDTRCLFGHGESSGKDRGNEALKRALKSPLISEGMLIQNASNLLVHIVGGESLTLTEVQAVMGQLSRRVSEHTQIHFGLGVNPKMGDKLSVTLISSISADSMASYQQTAAEANTVPVKLKPEAGTEAVATAPKSPALRVNAESGKAAPTSKTNTIPVTKTTLTAKAKPPALPTEEDLFTGASTNAARIQLPTLPVAVAETPKDLFAHLIDNTPETDPLAETEAPKTAPLSKLATVEEESQVEEDPVVYLAPEDNEPEPLFAESPEPEMEEEEYVEMQEEEEELVTAAAEPEPTLNPTASVLTKAINIPALAKVDKPIVDEVMFDDHPLTPIAPATAPAPRTDPALQKSESLLKKLTRAFTDTTSAPAPVKEEVAAKVLVPQPVAAAAPSPARSIVNSTAAPSPVKSKSANVEQPMLAIAGNDRSNHFKDADQNIVQGEDLDTPTWMRLRRKVSR